MRKILLLFASVMMAVGMTACGGSGSGSGDEEQSGNAPETAVAGLLDAIKEGDQTKVNEYVTSDDTMHSENTESDITQAKIMFENITYNVKSVNADTEGIVIVTVDITNIDMAKVMQEYMQKGMAAAVGNPDMTEDEAMAMLQETIEQNKENTITKTVDLEVTQVDGEWKVKTTDELNSILAGGLSEEMLQ